MKGSRFRPTNCCPSNAAPRIAIASTLSSRCHTMRPAGVPGGSRCHISAQRERVRRICRSRASGT
eukprot:7318534-Alexandrium_andersonii.AAC.1